MRFAPLIVLTLFAACATSAMGADEDSITIASAKAARTLGPDGTDKDTCASCHARETDAWKLTHHFTTFKERHRSKEAKDILAAMGIKSMKRSDVCLTCHYTSVMEGGDLRPKWGVSCESCHGPGKDWMDVHNKVGGVATAKTLKWGEGHKEPPAERAKRLKAAEAKGMLSSGMVYEIASNCFGCHTVPNEKLVNVGGHKAGSDFDLVSWSQGEVRHNYVSSEGAPDHPTNRPATTEEKRKLYAVGALVDLEVSLRNLASAKDKSGKFEMAMVDRVNHARAKAEPVVKAAGDAALTAAFAAIPAKVDASTAIDPKLSANLGKATKGIVEKAAKFSALDPLIPKESKGTAAP
jgi:Cytochrome c554 and c-prime